MTVRMLNVWEVGSCIAGGRAFFEEGKLPGGIDPLYFINRWCGFVESGLGFILGLFDDAGQILGALAWKVAPGDFSPALFATEAWWFVFPGFRGFGVKLVDEFERWCDDRKIPHRLLIRLKALGYDALGRFYEARGYKELETVHHKEAM